MDIQGLKVIVDMCEVEAFNHAWPSSKLNSDRSYWFEFDESGLVDTDVPEQSDGPEVKVMAADCEAYLYFDVLPYWALQS